MLTAEDHLILLNAMPGIGAVKLARLRRAFGSLDHVWQASAEALREVPGVGPILAQRIVEIRGNLGLLARERELAERAGVSIVALGHPGYPAALERIPDPPLVLYLKGALHPADARAVAVVGTRHPSLYGLQTAERFGYELASCGVTVVSGLARGIDGAAHYGALGAGGRTLAVLGSGLGRIYPPEHDALAERIVRQGALISEYPMTASPRADHFPQRNRLISGLARGVVVIEAGPRSGSMITVDCALEQGREVFAVPGPITSPESQGTHGLLKQGAQLVTSVHDILEELFAEAGRAPAGRRMGEPGSAQERAVLQALERGPARHLEELAAEIEAPVAELQALLLRLELNGRVHQRPGQWYHLAGAA